MKEKSHAKARQARSKDKHNHDNNGATTQSPEELYNAAVQLAEQSQPEEAMEVAKQLWSVVKTRSLGEALPALNLLGEISLELGDASAARSYFEEAAQRDPTGEAEGPLGGGAEKFLWLAQLCEEGGKQSVSWFEKGAKVLEQEIAQLQNGSISGVDADSVAVLLAEKKARLAHALCGVVEVYMTDLSWEIDAEERCEKLITHAMAVEEETSPEVLQTLASIRLSQDRKEDAQAALRRSYDSWKDLDADDDNIPEFATRISLSRLLMEAEMEIDAMDVLDLLTLEDDQSVEAWYLGGWCQYLLAAREKSGTATSNGHDGVMESSSQVEQAQRTSRRWLKMALKLYDQIDYEDDRLKEHALELVADLDSILGADDGDDQEDEEIWEGLDGAAEDEEMKDV